MAANAIRTALARLGFSNDAANFITADQEMDTLQEFELLTDEEVESLCRVIRRPGGTMANPNAATQGQPADIPNPGIAVPLRAENNLKLACFFLRFRAKTSRDTTAADITLDAVRALVPHREWEKEHQDVESPEINAKDWPRTIEAIEEWLRGKLGVTKIPLAYVVREEVAIPATDPTNGYANKQDELIARAPIEDPNNAGHFVPTYLTDRGRVWELISELTREHDCWSYVRPAQKSRDGRLAFTGLRGHYLGVNNVDNMSSRAESKLQNTSYTGEKRRWNFEKYVKVHIDQHAILEGLKQHGYSGVDERSKVRHLLAGIRTNALDTVKTRIMSEATLRSDFAACVNLFQDFIEQSGTASTTKDVTIAAVRFADQTTPGTTEKPGAQADMTMEDRYYTKSEYANLTNAQKYGLKLKRDQRGHQPGAKDSKRKRTPSSGGVDLSNRSIKAIASAIRDDNQTEDGEEEADEPDPKKSKSEVTNRNNPALKKKGGKR